ncbi:DMT family transporter [Dehalogenimonas alkenigignens]|uniref:Permeases of the drug/metabolite transporter (DMT) superfamily n=1 Tax=Dehalogenimonas alkenigignens TaxID=1217799 RepID=A0A0W0GJM8_9CHLR|nr:DMT family transporter [Dehalogenimonas alkenigignens]KTB48774.1 Permeases of the drug/metabolite transporter (DMT) superfamily [Dehalogenimonas alkenigignens]PVV84814.1 EamA/RhaT family transporter [Dehalogenimonas alkenigignens]
MSTGSGVDRRALIGIAITMLFWASSFAGIRAGLESFSPGALVLFRFLIGSATLAAWVVFRESIRLPRLSDMPLVLAGGLIGITVYHICLAYGEQTVTAASASFIIGAVPIFTGLLAVVTLNERLGLRQWLGIVTSFTGIGLIALGEGGHLELEKGALAILLAAVCTSVYFVIQKRLLRTYTPLEVTCYAFWVGTALMLFFLPQLAAELPEAALGPALAVVYLGIFPAAMAYVIWNYVFSRTTASVATSFMYLNPIAATIIAWIWLGETPSPLAGLGGLLALGGVILTARSIR